MQLTQQTGIKQTTALSARQQQSLKLLAMSSLALSDAIEQELESNPTLEKADNTADDEGFPVEKDNNADNSADSLGDFAWPAYRDNAPRYSRFTETNEDESVIDNQTAPGESLSEHLIRQLEVICDDEGDFEIAAEIATSLDDDGYLRLSTEYLADELGVSVGGVERVLTGVVQSLDPPGVAARDLRECLLIQWRSSTGKPSLVGEIIERYLGDIGKKPPAQIAENLGVTLDEFNEALAVLRSYEPIPGRMFGRTDSKVLVPDIKVDLVDGEINVSLVYDNIPRLRLSWYYRKMLEKPEELDK
ncbi:MAG: hypothetical protein GY771_12770, partial [bacterium]|nr:hypothetical protein [bacterium]